MRKKFFISIIAAILLLSSACEKDNPTAEESETVLSVTSENSETTVSETTAAATSETKLSQTETETEIPTETTVPETDWTFTRITSQPYGESVSEQNILMFSIEENLAWSFYQYVDVLAADGNCYSVYTDDVDLSFKPWIDENWYSRLEEIAAAEESRGHILDTDLETIRNFKDNFGIYKDYPYKIYDGNTVDGGTSSLYGIYFDENSVPQYVELCSFGDFVSCIYDKDVADFVNSIDITIGKYRIEEQIFFPTYYEFDY